MKAWFGDLWFEVKFAAVLVTITVGLWLVAGCKDPAYNGGGASDGADASGQEVAKSTNTSAVIIGMETSKFAGDCPGEKIDSQRMKALVGQYTDDVAYFSDETATHDAVKAAMVKAIAKGGLTIIYYSGHGGSQKFWDTGAEEVDGQDEFLCLYDTYMRDNEIWSIISKSQGRVWLVFDCCHSATMFRVPCFTMRAAMQFTRDGARESGQRDGDGFSMLCWSGCPDDTYSYGSTTGGQFTNALLRHFAANKSYEYLWSEIKADSTLKKYEDCQQTVIGTGFTGKAVFR